MSIIFLTNAPSVVRWITMINKNNLYLIGSVIGLLFSLTFSYGLSFIGIPFQSSFFILQSFIILAFGIHFILKSDKSNTTNEKTSEYQDLFIALNEKDEVIREYERLLDEQYVSIPCNCGGELFEGILLPNSDNLTDCKSCKEKYKIFISYDSILTTQPSDNNTIFENLINKKLD